jgi:hypothetical protein
VTLIGRKLNGAAAGLAARLRKNHNQSRPSASKVGLPLESNICRGASIDRV